MKEMYRDQFGEFVCGYCGLSLYAVLQSACYLFCEFFTLIQVTVECTKKELVTKLMDVQHSSKHPGLRW